MEETDLASWFYDPISFIYYPNNIINVFDDFCGFSRFADVFFVNFVWKGLCIHIMTQARSEVLSIFSLSIQMFSLVF